jgi:hypothetical protein
MEEVMKLLFGLRVFTREYKNSVKHFYRGASLVSDQETEIIKKFKLTQTLERMAKEFELDHLEIALLLNEDLFYKKL